VRIHPDHHSIHHAPPLTLTGTTVSEDGQRCFEQTQQTLLEPRLAAVTGQDARQKRATPANAVGSRV
jgi:hypothetical protein